MARRSEVDQDRMTWLNFTNWVARRRDEVQDHDGEVQGGGSGPDAMDKLYQVGGEAQDQDQDLGQDGIEQLGGPGPVATGKVYRVGGEAQGPGPAG